ncbi:DUF6036 family nucleotidyltransferase [Phenylobacterium sp.]|uniref:DUF6036 family nucleotidyltransferase n=1 Tax=Phenylobacterium sp. TaxID=1871053 RepID=UPI0027233E25|nr:DUF6036 family nucleotidyltransferase [Phenylobacterium sp.]MDO8377422.1 hypothetical protein [Phenylobacterium sp.]
MMLIQNVNHILRAAGEVTGQTRFVLIGSAAVIAWRRVVPVEMAMTREVDLFAYDVEDVDGVSEELDGSLGQGSNFDNTFGYYCDGVGAETAILPTDWLDRAMEYRTPEAPGITAIVPEPEDIALAKLCAWRPKDISWLVAAARGAIIKLDVMRARLQHMPARAGDFEELSARLLRLDQQGRR